MIPWAELWYVDNVSEMMSRFYATQSAIGCIYIYIYIYNKPYVDGRVFFQSLSPSLARFCSFSFSRSPRICWTAPLALAIAVAVAVAVAVALSRTPLSRTPALARESKTQSLRLMAHEVDV